MAEKAAALYYRVMRRETFEEAAQNIFDMLVKAQKTCPNVPRKLYLDIDGHRNKKGGFDHDMLELQQNFCLGFLYPFLSEVQCPLIHVKNPKGQRNDIPEKLIISGPESKKDDSLEALYIENYSNTEFVSEPPVYEYLMHFSKFLKKYRKSSISFDHTQYKDFDSHNLLGIWQEYMTNMIIELFNNFIYGNLICATAMTRTLIECYVYVSILMKEKNPKLLEDWFLCSAIRKMPRQEVKNKEYDQILGDYCKKYGGEPEETYRNFLNQKENGWLSEIISKKRITFYDACEYLGESGIYTDFRKTSSFIHGQDIVSKIMPFTFYISVYNTLAMMIIYTCNVFRLFPLEEDSKEELNMLEKELAKLAEEMNIFSTDTFSTEDTP